MTTPDAPRLSIIVPMLDEVARLPFLAAQLAPFRQRGCEVLLVDGGSRDDSVAVARHLGLEVIAAPRGRARQMNAGAAVARGEMLLFLHADTVLPPQADALVAETLAARVHAWGRFDVRIVGVSRGLGLVAWMMNRRSRLTGIATGDQAMFATRDAFEHAGRFPEQPLMEDIALSKRLLSISRPACLATPVVTSGRRWDERGFWRTVLLMWRLRLAYWRGASPEALAARYR